MVLNNAVNNGQVPGPIPLASCLVEKKGSKIWGISSAEMPMPLSMISSFIESGSGFEVLISDLAVFPDGLRRIHDHGHTGLLDLVRAAVDQVGLGGKIGDKSDIGDLHWMRSSTHRFPARSYEGVPVQNRSCSFLEKSSSPFTISPQRFVSLSIIFRCCSIDSRFEAYKVRVA